MTLIDTIKSALGLGDPTASDHAADSTDERDAEADAGAPETAPGPTGSRTPGEPDAASERAVKTERPHDRNPSTTDSADVTTTDSADDATGTDAAPSTDDTDTTAIKGIGSAYADRLSAAGVDSVADLAGADAEAIAADTDISATRIEDWIERADARTR